MGAKLKDKYKPDELRTESQWSGLGLRIVVGALLALFAIGAIWFGDWVFAAVVALVSLLVLWEWCALTEVTTSSLMRPIGIVALACLLLASQLGYWPEAAIAFAVMSVVLLLLAYGFSSRQALWLAFGFCYSAFPGLALLWMRQLPHGAAIILWLVLTIAATDIGAYFSGRSIGGPKLAPYISPNKTWAGLLGGMAAAAAVGMVFGKQLAIGMPWRLAALSSIVAVVAQLGDLTESAIKRGFGAKDSGSILPGHGGIMDRLDGYVFTAPLLAFALSLPVAGNFT